MKLKYIALSLTLFFCSINLVNASSINYNVKIDKNLHFYETITYNIDKKDVKTNGNYDFLTSVVNDTIYFDLKEEIPYTKNKRSDNNQYIVTLKNDYASLFLEKSRILNECFTNRNIENTISTFSFRASEFYCNHRADKITVTVTTDLEVESSNASQTTNNQYIWNNINKDFNMNIKLKMSAMEDEPMDETTDNTDNTNTDNQKQQEQQQEEQQKDKKENTKKSNIAIYIFAGIIMIIALGVIFVVPTLKKKSSSINKI